MLFDVYYDMGCNEGWDFETFDNINDALKFAEKQVESRIVGYHQCIPLTFRSSILFSLFI